MDQAYDNDQALTRDSLYGTAAEPTYAGITSFMRRRYSRDLRGVDLVVSGVPFDTATTNRPGSRFGPRAIRAASVQSAWARHFPWEFDPFDLLACIDYGDCYFDHGTPQDTPTRQRARLRSHGEHHRRRGQEAP
jgi:agmatinase